MKRRIYLIGALALINLVIMKYNDLKSEKRGNIWAIAVHEHTGGADSLLSSSSATK